MNRLKVFLIILSAMPLFAQGQQNLISNGNFEQYSSCPTGTSQVSTNCVGWSTWNTASPDYYHSCNTGNQASVPVNWFGFQNAASGNAYIGIVDNWSNGGWREYVKASIPPLQIGAVYEFSMSVSSADIMKLATNGLGVHFFDVGPASYTSSGIINVTPKISYAGNGVITDTANWVRLTNTFTADSAYDNIVIGSFLAYSSMTITNTGWGSSPNSYYYIDSVVLKIYDSLFLAFTDTVKCSGDTLKINYISSKKKQSNNVFTLQLSNSSGSFTSPVNIGTIASDTSGVITAVIPTNTPTGTGYKLRLVASNYPDTSEHSIVFKIGQGPIIKPVANNNSPVCNSDTLKLTASTSTSGVTWSWTGPNSFNSSLQNPTIPNPTTVHNGNYIVTARLYGCMAKDTTTATVFGGSGASGTLATSNAPICADDTLKLFGTANGTGLTYSWTGPNSFASNQQNIVLPSATVALSGDYILYVSNGNCTSRDTVTVIVKPRPANFNAVYNNPVCTSNPINFTASSSSTGVTYVWTGPNSFSSSSATPSIGGASSVHNGDYFVTAILNGCSLKDTLTISVKPQPAKPDANNNGPLCAGATLNITATSATSGVTWGWIGANSFTSTTQNPNFTNSTTTLSGDYIVTADLNGCVSKDTTTVLVKPVPAAVTLSTNSPLCVGSTVLLLSTASTTGATYAWTGPNSFSASTQNSSVTNATTAASGWYKMTVNLNGCTYKDSSSVTVNPIPATPVATYSSPLCVGETLQLSTSTVTGATYNWTGPNSFSSTLRNPTRSSMQFGDTGKYDVSVTVNGCTSPAGSTTVTINPTPFVVILANPDSICQGNPAAFTAYPNNHAGTPTYQWLVNLQPAGSGTTFNTSTLNHNDVIRCDMTEYTKCSVPYKDESNDVSMTVLPWKAPSVSISAVPMQPLKANEYITFTAAPVDAGLIPKYQWKRNGQNVVGATGSIWSANTLNDNDEICVEIISSYKCPQPLTAKSNCIKVKVLTGVNDIDGSNSAIVVFPNPNKGRFTIKGKMQSNDLVHIEVLNYLGQVIHTQAVQPANQQLDTEIQLQDVAKGIYLLRLHTEHTTQQVKLTVE